ncbi:uncharacterized protein LOC130625987 [Hydractinia symbiolongicarpus]|uniref:uncharacterized protein LOC130625987 n=1 Tax=Hydractinia symbiolongicarpus TaxID=13093 RepID=UPI00254B4387|nr:uncharacterized protein LOC130625987 [Hydractinia symbiolongicarpus]
MITHVSECDTPLPKRRKLLFSKEERSAIVNKQMLTDESINIAQSLLVSQFPTIGGFQDTVVGKTQSFDIVKYEENYIQLLHAGSLHWICVANVNNRYCQIFDSLTSGNVSVDVANQIAAFSYCQSEELVIDVMPVQQQKNGVDCGLFSIAFATSLAFGEHACDKIYGNDSLRPHLLSCLDAGQMTPFPSKLRARKRTLRPKKQIW